MGQVEVHPQSRATLAAANKKAKRAAAPRRLAKPCKRLHGALAISVLATAMWMVTVPASAASPSPPPSPLPPTLAGESFSQTTNDESLELGCGSVLGVSPDGTHYLYGGSLTFTVSGVASGPYPGTFTETVMLTASGQSGVTFPERAASGTVTSAHATFTITAADGSTVTGSKSLDLTAPSSCYFYPGPGGVVWRDSASLFYDAQITTIHGTYRETGTASAAVETDSVRFPVPGFESSFAEDFTASNGLRPTATTQCKKGGWARFGVFKNQGECVRSVATKGKNPPG